MLSKDYEAKTEKEALKKAGEELKLNENDLKYEILEKQKKNLLGFGKPESIKIRVYYRENNETDPESKIKIIEQLFDMININADVSITKENDRTIINIFSNDNMGLLIGKNGKTLEAIQTLISNFFNKNEGNERIIVDINSYRKQKEHKLVDLALKAAADVKKKKRPRLLEPMNPFERRIIHMTLKEDREVETASEGEGNFRKIKISPTIINYNNEAE